MGGHELQVARCLAQRSNPDRRTALVRSGVKLDAEERALLLDFARGRNPLLTRFSVSEAALLQKLGARSPAHAVVMALLSNSIGLRDVARIQGIQLRETPYAEEVAAFAGTPSLPVLRALAAGHDRSLIAKGLGLSPAQLNHEVVRASQILLTRDETETILRALVSKVIALDEIQRLILPTDLPLRVMEFTSDRFDGNGPISPAASSVVSLRRKHLDSQRRLATRLATLASDHLSAGQDQRPFIRFVSLVLANALGGDDHEAGKLTSTLFRAKAADSPPPALLNLAELLWRQADAGEQNGLRPLRLQLGVELALHAVESRYLSQASNGGDAASDPNELRIGSSMRLARWMRERWGWSPALINYIVAGDPDGLAPPTEELRRARWTMLKAARQLINTKRLPDRRLEPWRAFGWHLLETASRLAATEASADDDTAIGSWQLVEGAWDLTDATQTAAHRYLSPALSREDRRYLIEIVRGGSTERIAGKLGETEAYRRVRERALIRRFGVRNREEVSIAALRGGLLNCVDVTQGTVSLDFNNLYRRILDTGELWLLFGMALGENDQQLAARLKVSISQLEKEVPIVLAKLGARNRAHAVALAHFRGTLPIAIPFTDATPIGETLEFQPPALELLQLIAQGLTQAEIGTLLGKNQRLVSLDVVSLRRQLGAANLPQLVALALEKGLLPRDVAARSWVGAVGANIRSLYAGMLTRREAEVLESTSRCEPRDAALRRLGMSGGSFDGLVVALKSKLGSRNRAQLVANALHYGLVEFSARPLKAMILPHEAAIPSDLLSVAEVRPLVSSMALGLSERAMSQAHGKSVLMVRHRLLEARDRAGASSRGELVRELLRVDPELARQVSRGLELNVDETVDQLFHRLIHPAHRELLTLVAQGRTQREIADRRGYSRSSLSTELASVVSRLDASNIIHAVLLAAHNGIIPLENLEVLHTADAPRPELTELDRQLLRLVTLGVPEWRIAEDLELSSGRVEGCIRALKRKLGATNRLQLVTLPFARTLVSANDLGLFALNSRFPDVSSALEAVVGGRGLQQLLLASKDWTVPQIAAHFGVGDSAVDFELAETRQRLGATSSLHAFSLALRHRLFTDAVVQPILHLLRSG